MVEADRPKHVVLYAMVRWFAKHRESNHEGLSEIVVPSTLCEEEYPVGFYEKKYVTGLFNQLHNQGYVERATFHGRSMGYVLSEKGIEAIEELGRPEQYDH